MLLLLLTACLTNPATGRLQLNLLSSSAEIKLGEDLAAQTTATVPLVEDDELQEYVSGVVHELAALSERPELPWRVQVLDDATVNAFALPGGHLYITRGLMTWLGSQDELAAVLGHEIGHVTARHSANTLSRTILASPLIGLVGILDPDMNHVGLLTGVGTGLARLSHSREDERQADDLGLRYMTRAGYDPSAMLDVFTVLAAVEESGEGARLPTWLLTHPTPTDRRSRLGAVPASGTRRISDYLNRIDGMVFGADPRQGFFDGDRFHHPELAFQLDFPVEWTHLNRPTAVTSASPAGDATLELSHADAQTPQEALDAFFAPDEILTRPVQLRIGTPFRYQVVGRDGATRAIDGVFLALEHRGSVYTLIGMGTLESWPASREAVLTSMATFAEEQDPAVLSRQPDRLRVGVLPEAVTLARFATMHPGTDARTLSRLNRVSDRLPAGMARWVDSGAVVPVPVPAPKVMPEPEPR